MDIGKAFSFVFEDEDWIVKILIAAAILLLGLVFSWVLAIPLIVAMLFVAGYSVEITRRVIQGNPDELPRWDNWGNLLADGVKVAVIGLVYGLPLIVAGICQGVSTGLFTENAEGLAVFLNLIFGCFGFLWSIAMSFVLPAAIAFYVVQNDLSAAFRFKEVFNLVRNNPKTYLITLVMSWVAGLVGSLGLLVCGIGWLVTGPYSWMVTGHLYGQAYLEATGQVPQATFEEEAIV